MEIHQLIEKERVKAGLTQDEIAARLGIKRSTYQYWEKSTPGTEKIRAVARVLGLPDDYFFVQSDEQAITSPPPSWLPDPFWVVMKTLADTQLAQTEILKEIRMNMARQDSQARIEANLILALAGVESLKFARDRADERDAKSSHDRSAVASKGVRKKARGTGSDGHKRGIRP